MAVESSRFKLMLLMISTSFALSTSAAVTQGKTIAEIPDVSRPRLQSHSPGTMAVLGIYREHPGYVNDLSLCMAEAFHRYGDELPFYKMDLDNWKISKGFDQIIQAVSAENTVLLVKVVNKNGDLKPLKQMPLHDCTSQKLEVALLTHASNATVKLEQSNFASKVLTIRSQYQPYLVLFYADWNPSILSHIKAFHRTAEELSDLSSNVISASLDLNEHAAVLHESLPDYNPTRFPFVLYFYSTRKRQSEVAYLEFDGVVPTPLSIIQFLNESGQPLTNKAGDVIDYRPSGSSSGEVSLLSEGPLGYECYAFSSNLTDSQPRVWARPRVTRNSTAEDEKPPRDWFDLKPVDLEMTISKLERSEAGVPVLTESSWDDVHGKSYPHSHPFSRPQEHPTRVSVVIFIRAECDFCDKSAPVFQNISRQIERSVDMAQVYLVNCSASSRLCEEQEVSGYPTIVAYRSLSWLHRSDCLSEGTAAQFKYARHDYHGLIRVKDVMNWFSEIVMPAVQILWTKEEKESFHHLGTDSHLLAVVMPADSPHLPARKRMLGEGGRAAHLPYECYRLACERMFGQVACAGEFYYKLGERDKQSTLLADTVVYQIVLHRRDGFESIVMDMDRPFQRVIAAESEKSFHRLHPRHKYGFSDTQKCEDDHSFCTDHIVEYTLDHARLLVSSLDSKAFHTHQGRVTHAPLPILAALVYPENTLTEVANELYNKVRVVTVDVRQYHYWTNLIVPKHYIIDSELAEEETWLYRYPRICMLENSDHSHAAFYPDISHLMSLNQPFSYNKSGLLDFAKSYLDDPQQLLVETEVF